jgi:diguanylate cyclase (GGDEF)-like protein
MDSWRAFLRLGFGVYLGESLVVGAYLAVSSAGPHRSALVIADMVGAVAALLNLLALQWLCRQPWVRSYSVAWTLFAGIFLTAFIFVDGGLSSPLLPLLLLPVMYGALIFGPFDVGMCVVAAVIEVVVLAITDTGADERPGATILAIAAAAGIGVVVWLAARHRCALEARAAMLTDELERLATTDGLTGCLNHRAFFERLDEEIGRALRYNEPLSLVVTDIDHFKALNDSLGHAGGDAALRRVGQILRSGSRRPDAVGRIGGDEFAILLPATTVSAAGRHATRLLHPTGTELGQVTLSAGVATLDRDEATADRLFRDADRALYHVKDTGRAGVGVMPIHGAPIRLGQSAPSIGLLSVRGR